MSEQDPQTEELREIAQSLAQVTADLAASRDLLARQQGELDRAFFPRQEFDTFMRRVLRRDNIKTAVLAVLIVVMLTVMASNRNTLSIIKHMVSPEQRAESNGRVGGFLCALVANDHVLHNSPPPAFLVISSPIFVDGKPTGDFETIPFRCRPGGNP